jgi:uncharacterized protein
LKIRDFGERLANDLPGRLTENNNPPLKFICEIPSDTDLEGKFYADFYETAPMKLPLMNPTESAKQLAVELKLSPVSVAAAIELLENGNTIPFIARYRKEVTSGLDEIALRSISDGWENLQSLLARKKTVWKTIEEQGLLTDDLRQQIESCRDLAVLEMIYAPFKPKRKTRGMLARELGLEGLADFLQRQENASRARGEILKPYVNPKKGVPDARAALQGALDILAEAWADSPQHRSWMLDQLNRFGLIRAVVKRGRREEAQQYQQFLDRSERVSKIPGHRLLAMLRGEQEGVLKVKIDFADERTLQELERSLLVNRSFEFFQEMRATVADCYQRLLLPGSETALLSRLKDQADEEAIDVFGKNLQNLLMAPPAGPRVTMGVDPGFRTGCKIAVVDATGKLLDHATIFPTPPKNDTVGAGQKLLNLIRKHQVELIAIGNGTASRETDAFVADLIREHRLSVTPVMISEAGASIYSASPLAAEEFPQLDLTIRGAVSIARRLQDPLAELVKIDAKSIGVGQYQHDVNQTRLKKCLDRTVESCVNRVGVDLNRASVALLSYVSGIGPALAAKIVEHRNQNGAFHSREELLQVAKLGKRSFQQAAGFLRVSGGKQPLDNSAVHPESYGLVERMAMKLGIRGQALIGNPGLCQQIKPAEFVDQRFGIPTITDILEELAKPGRDPREKFLVPKFDERIQKIEDLAPNLVVEGVITNVTRFGAFVDIGVHQDALIHISQLADHFVADPDQVVKVGDIVKVRILEVDPDRKRISVTRKTTGDLNLPTTVKTNNQK